MCKVGAKGVGMVTLGSKEAEVWSNLKARMRFGFWVKCLGFGV